MPFMANIQVCHKHLTIIGMPNQQIYYSHSITYLVKCQYRKQYFCRIRQNSAFYTIKLKIICAYLKDKNNERIQKN